MKKVIFSIFAFFLTSNLYAGWTTGGVSGMVIGSEGELLVPSKDLKDKLIEAATNGSIILPSSEGEKELIPSAFDFKKNIYKFRNPETDEQVILRDSEILELQVQPKLEIKPLLKIIPKP